MNSTASTKSASTTPARQTSQFPDIRLPNPANLFTNIWQDEQIDGQYERGRTVGRGRNVNAREVVDVGDVDLEMRGKLESLKDELSRAREKSRAEVKEEESKRSRMMAEYEKRDMERSQERARLAMQADREKDNLLKQRLEAEEEVREFAGLLPFSGILA